jgi:hypothetical protein
MDVPEMVHTSLTELVPAICTSLAEPGSKNSKQMKYPKSRLSSALLDIT